MFKKQTVTGNKMHAGTFLSDNSFMTFKEFCVALLLGVAMLVDLNFSVFICNAQTTFTMAFLAFTVN